MDTNEIVLLDPNSNARCPPPIPQSYGKLTYFITLFPYVVLTIFLVMGSFEEGFVAGITDYYLKVQKLPKVQAEIT